MTSVYRPNRIEKVVSTGEPLILTDELAANFSVESKVELLLKQAQIRAQQQAMDETHRLISQAKAEAERIVSEAIAQADAQAKHIIETQTQPVLEQARQEGYEAGMMRAAELVQQQLSDADEVMGKAFESQAMLIQQAKPQMIQLMQLMLTTLIGQHFETRPDAWSDIIENALKQVMAEGHVKIRLHPDVLKRFDELSPEITARIQGMAHIQFIPHHSYGPMDMVLETVEASYDISPMTMMERLLAKTAPTITDIKLTMPAAIEPQPDVTPGMVSSASETPDITTPSLDLAELDLADDQ